jgi:hypothetical protein
MQNGEFTALLIQQHIKYVSQQSKKVVRYLKLVQMQLTNSVLLKINTTTINKRIVEQIERAIQQRLAEGLG